jgi:hypothetical protein
MFAPPPRPLEEKIASPTRPEGPIPRGQHKKAIRYGVAMREEDLSWYGMGRQILQEVQSGGISRRPNQEPYSIRSAGLLRTRFTGPCRHRTGNCLDKIAASHATRSLIKFKRSYPNQSQRAMP